MHDIYEDKNRPPCPNSDAGLNHCVHLVSLQSSYRNKSELYSSCDNTNDKL